MIRTARRRPRSALLRGGLALSGLLLAAGPSSACGWSWETYEAEAVSLPCVYDTVLGYFPIHTRDYHEAVIRAVDYGLDWAPHFTAGLDAKGLALLHLKRYPEAARVLERRLAAAPDAYPSHANLGTLYTFTGEYERALAHVDRAMKIEPNAHFGREGYHRKLVEYLAAEAKDPRAYATRNFLGLTLTSEDRLTGSPEKFREKGLKDDAFDALVSMIAVYGADEVPELYLTLGDLLALRGDSRLAWSSYRRAVELRHPRAEELGGWIAEMAALAAAKNPRSAPQRSLGDGLGTGFDAPGKSPEGDDVVMRQPGGNRGLPYMEMRTDARAARAFYAKWEQQQLALGLPVWTTAGIHTLYEQMNRIRIRCRVPGVIDERAPLDPFSESASPKNEKLPCPLCTWEGRAQAVFGSVEVPGMKAGTK